MMRKIFGSALVCTWALITITGCGAQAATYYVNSSATNGLNDGSSMANAWTAIPTVWKPTPIHAGDVVLVNGGYYTPTNGFESWTPVGGTPQNPVQYIATNGMVLCDGQGSNFWMGQGAANVVISGGPSTNWTVTNYVNLTVYADGASYLTLDHLNIYGCMRFNGSTDIQLEYCLVQPPNGFDHAIFWGVTPDASFNPNNPPYTNSTIHNCVINCPRQKDAGGFGADGIQFNGYGWSVYSNLISSYFVTSYIAGQHQDAMQGACNDICVYDNVFQNMANSAFFFDTIATTPMVFSNIFVYNNVFQITNSYQYDLGYTVAIYFALQGGDATLCAFTNVVIANNTVVDYFGRDGIDLSMTTGTTQTNFWIVNNIVCNCSGNNGFETAMAVYPWNNNAVWSTNGMCISYNLLDPGISGTMLCTPKQLAAPVTATSHVKFMSYIQARPGNDLHLDPSDGNARTNGMNLSSLYPFLIQDKDGVPRPPVGNWDIGAYQTTSGAVAQTGTSTNTLNSGSTDGTDPTGSTGPDPSTNVVVATSPPPIPPAPGNIRQLRQ